jgi:hypothetical protein
MARRARAGTSSAGVPETSLAAAASFRTQSMKMIVMLATPTSERIVMFNANATSSTSSPSV